MMGEKKSIRANPEMDAKEPSVKRSREESVPLQENRKKIKII